MRSLRRFSKAVWIYAESVPPALDLCYIAAGRIDGYFEKLLHPWDIAAGYLILREAGGRVTDYSGGGIQFAAPTSLVASNGVIHAFLLDAIKKYNG